MSSPQNTFEPYTASKNTPILSKATQQFGQYYHTPQRRVFEKTATPTKAQFYYVLFLFMSRPEISFGQNEGLSKVP